MIKSALIKMKFLLKNLKLINFFIRQNLIRIGQKYFLLGLKINQNYQLENLIKKLRLLHFCMQN